MKCIFNQLLLVLEKHEGVIALLTKMILLTAAGFSDEHGGIVHFSRMQHTKTMFAIVISYILLVVYNSRPIEFGYERAAVRRNAHLLHKIQKHYSALYAPSHNVRGYSSIKQLLRRFLYFWLILYSRMVVRHGTNCQYISQ